MIGARKLRLGRRLFSDTDTGEKIQIATDFRVEKMGQVGIFPLFFSFQARELRLSSVILVVFPGTRVEIQLEFGLSTGT